MSDKIPFRPISGLDATIQDQVFNEGNLYFATDTGKIYLDTYKDGKAGHQLMGGSSSGFHFAQGTDQTIVIQDEDTPNPYYYITFGVGGALEDSTVVPQKNDLILNSDGAFYRVWSVDEENHRIMAFLIAVSGGGGSGPAVVQDLDLQWDDSTIQSSGSTYVFGRKSIASFIPSSTIDSSVYLTFNITDNTKPIDNVTNPINRTYNNLPTGQKFDFDTSILPESNDITMTVTVGSPNSSMINGYSRRFMQIKTVAMGIGKVNATADGYIPMVPADDISGSLEFSYIPYGNSSINLTRHVYVDGVELESARAPISNYGRAQKYAVARQSHGVHRVGFAVSTTINGEEIYSETIEYQGAWASAGDETPIIWVGNYDKTIVNYENSYIQFNVYEPLLNSPGANSVSEISISLYKDGNLAQEMTFENFDNTTWKVWDISNLYVLGDNNVFSIVCRSTRVDVDIDVTAEGSRNLGLIEESLLLNITTAGRSKLEIKSRRNVLESTVYKDNIVANLKNFNWQNNGWNDSEGVDAKGVDSGSFLSIANDAALDITLGTGGLTLNAAKNYTFEFRFRVRNVQEYSTLVKVIPKYFYMVPDETAEDGWRPTYIITTSGEEQVITGPSKYEWEIERDGQKIGVDEYGNLLMDEKNTTKDVETEKGVVVKWINNDGLGFCIGTQEAYFKTPSGVANVRYSEDEVINLSMVVSTTDKLCYVYLNGILSGAIEMPSGDGSAFIIRSPFMFNSKYCDFDLYRFRVYEAGLTMPNIIHNYLSDMHSIVLYDQNQLTDPLDETALSYDLLVQYNEDHPDAVTMPYAVWQITGGTDELLPWKKGNKRSVTVDFVNPPLDRALDIGEIDEWHYYTHSPSFHAEKVNIDVQGTSSQKYPRRNYKTKFKDAKDTWVYTKGSLAGKPLTDSYLFDANNNFVISSKDLEALQETNIDEYNAKKALGVKKLAKKFHMDTESFGTNKFTWKIDYMESSGSYNTGFANLMGNLVHPLYTKHPLDDYGLGVDTSDMRTTVYGFPVLTFHKYADGYYEYIGRYNINLDKGSNEYYGFEDEAEQTWAAPRTKKVKNENNEYVDVEYQPTIAEIAECWELRDNQGTWCSMKYPDDAARAAGFGTLQEGTSGDNAKLEVIQHFEYRYSYYGDQLDSAYEYAGFTDPNTQVEYSSTDRIGINNYLREKYSNLEALFNWLDSTNPETATENALSSPVTWKTTRAYSGTGENSIPDFTYEVVSSATRFDQNTQYYIKEGNEYIEVQIEEFASGVTYYTLNTNSYNTTFLNDTAGYRINKFKNEFNLHLDKEYCLTYFVLTELLLCYDSRGKNMMLATFGPQHRGGEYIWYPIFYDIDTQLGLNNSGAYLWDYDADVTKDNLFSTPTSVLWNNLYEVFYEDIKQKYRVLRSISNPSPEDAKINGSLTYTNIAGAYECDPVVFNSYAMAGVRPIVAIGLDEYYKYLAPALTAADFNNLDKRYAGYYDTSGAHLYQLNGPTYVYACQGDKKLTTETLLRNRLNYIDSWWLGGDYRAGVVENQIFIRANANHSSTSDKILDATEYGNVLPENLSTRGYSLGNYPVNDLDARPGAQIKPFLHQYVSYFMDNLPSVPIKYDGSNGQENGVWTNVDAAKLVAFKREPDLSQQITYIPGGDYISKLGDLSLAYPNSLQIFHGQRLLELKLGNDHPGYDNPLLTSSSDFELAEMPLLQSVNLSHLKQFNRELTFTASKKLQEFRALDTIIERVNFAPGAPLHTVHLPATMTTVSLVQNQELKKLITSTPTVSINNETGKYECNNARGLFIDGVTNYDPLNAGSGHKISTLVINGGGLGYNAYTILKNLYDLKYGAQVRNKLAASLTNMDWTPYEEVEYGTPYDSGQIYYLLTEHSTFERITGTIPSSEWADKTLNSLIYTYHYPYEQIESGTAYDENETYYSSNDGRTFTEIVGPIAAGDWTSQTNEGSIYVFDSSNDENVITSLELFDNFIESYKEAVRNGTDSQFANTSSSSTATVPTISGTVYVANTPETPIKESDITDIYQTYWPSLKIQAANVTTSYVLRFVQILETGKESEFDVKRFDRDKPYEIVASSKPVPTKTNYDFMGWSLDKAGLHMVFDYEDGEYKQSDYYDSTLFSQENDVITLYAKFVIHSYNVTFYNAKDDNIYTEDDIFMTSSVNYGSYVQNLEAIPSKDSSGLELDRVYIFQGWSLTPGGKTIDITNCFGNKDYNFYPIFAEGSVYENIIPYSNLKKQTYVINGESINVVVPYDLATRPISGKITLPKQWSDGTPLDAVAGFGNIDLQSVEPSLCTATHIFFEEGSTYRFIIANAFRNLFTLEKFEWLDTIELIQQYAFGNCFRLTATDLTNATSLTTVEGSAFLSAFNTLNEGPDVIIRLPHTIVNYGDAAFGILTPSTQSASITKARVLGGKLKAVAEIIVGDEDHRAQSVNISNADNWAREFISHPFGAQPNERDRWPVKVTIYTTESGASSWNTFGAPMEVQGTDVDVLY